MEDKITFKDLSLALKISVVLAWVVGIIYSLLFLIGFIEAYIGV